MIFDLTKRYEPSNDLNHVDIILVGTINFIDTVGECKIEIYSGEGQIPHFHIKNKDRSKGKFDCCIMVYSAEYFDHGTHTDKLTKSQCKQMNEFFKQKDTYNPNKTLWDAMVNYWNASNPDCKFPNYKKVKSQPDYSKLNS